MSLERGVCSCAELQVFSCYRGWMEACQATRAISTTWRRELSSSSPPRKATRNHRGWVLDGTTQEYGHWLTFFVVNVTETSYIPLFFSCTSVRLYRYVGSVCSWSVVCLSLVANSDTRTLSCEPIRCSRCSDCAMACTIQSSNRGRDIGLLPPPKQRDRLWFHPASASGAWRWPLIFI